MKKDRAKKITRFFLIIFIVMNYAHGFLPQYLSPKTANSSFSEYLNFIELKYGSSIPNKVLILVISPGMLVGKILRYIVYNQEVKPMPKIPIKKREGGKGRNDSSKPWQKSPGFFYTFKQELAS